MKKDKKKANGKVPLFIEITLAIANDLPTGKSGNSARCQLQTSRIE
jgi:hypothetical protein